MAVSFSAATTAENVGGSSTTFSFTGNGLGTVPSTSFGIVFVWIESGGSQDPATVTWGGSGMTKLIGGIATPGRGWSSLWYKLAPASGAVTLAGTYSVADSAVVIWSLYDGVKQVAPEASNSGTANTQLSITVNATTITDNAWLVGGASNNFGVPTAGTATTGRFLNVRSLFDSNGGKSPAGSYGLQLTNGSNANWGMGVAAIAPNGISYTITAVAGTYAITGNPVNFNRGIMMPAVSGNYVLTGNAVNFQNGKGLVAESGVYSITGNPVLFRFSGWVNQSKNPSTWTDQNQSV